MTAGHLTPPWWRRPPAVGATIVGTLALLLALGRALREPGWATDFDQFHFAARALLRGGNPYTQIGPEGAFRWDWPLYYPLPTVLLVVPFAWLPVAAGRVAFAAVSGGVLGAAACRNGYWRLPLCLSASFLIAIFRSQWSPLVTSAFFLPWAALFLAAKPNVALAVVAGARSRRHLAWMLGLGAVLGAVSVVVRPGWIIDWVSVQFTREFISAPVVNPGGFLLLAALFRWRRPEARILAVLACVPQTPSLYDLLPLFVIPRTLRETTVLSLLTTALFLVVVVSGPFEAFNTYVHVLERWAIFVVYLPALWMVLRRPNVPTDPPRPPATDGPAGWLASLPRLDALLLALATVSAVLLAWLAMVTYRS